MTFSKAIFVFLTSALPFAELRAGIPLGIILGVSPVQTFLLAVLGSFLPVPVILFLLSRIEKLIMRYRFLKEHYEKLIRKIEKKKKSIEKYGYLGLAFFVAIPLPFTGAWSASVIAFILRMNPFKAMISIFFGLLIAALLVLFASLGIKLMLFF